MFEYIFKCLAAPVSQTRWQSDTRGRSLEQFRFQSLSAVLKPTEQIIVAGLVDLTTPRIISRQLCNTACRSFCLSLTFSLTLKYTIIIIIRFFFFFYCETSKERIRIPRFCAKSLTQKWDTLVVREAIYYDVMGSCILPVSTSSPELLDSNYCAGTSARYGTILMVFEKHWGFFVFVVAVIISQSMKKAVVFLQFCPEKGRMSS